MASDSVDRAQEQSDLIETAKSLYDDINSAAEKIEDAGTLPPEIVDLLKSNGMFDFMVPRVLGGAEVDALTALQIFEEITYANVAAGWAVLVNGTVAACAASLLGDEAAQDVFGDGTAILAGGIGQGGTAYPVEGGYLFGGKFRFGSATGHSTWVGGGGVLYDAEGEPVIGPLNLPMVRCVFVPRDKVTFKGNWDDVMGLKGSGSYDYDIAEHVVDAGYTFLLLGEPPKRGGPLYHFGVAGLIAIGQAGFPIGAARRALDEIAAIAPKRARMGHFGKIADQQIFQHDFAWHEAALGAARAYIREVFGEIEAYCIEHNAPPPPAEFMRLQQATTYAHRVSMDVVRFAFQWAGSYAVHAGTMERIFRDMEVANQHLFYDNMTLIRRSRVLFGIDVFPTPPTPPDPSEISDEAVSLASASAE